MPSWKEVTSDKIVTILDSRFKATQLIRLIELVQQEVEEAVIEMHEICKDCDGCSNCQSHLSVLKGYDIEV